jgi:prolyl oligopeptidase
VSDPYRWLEDPAASETAAWSREQDELARPFLDGLPGRDVLASRFEELGRVGTVGLPVHRGARTFFLRRAHDQEVAALWLRDGDGTEHVLLDPNAMDPQGTTVLDGFAPSLEGDRVAYQSSVGGDEESMLYVIDVASGRLLDGPIDRCRYSPVSWCPGGEEFYYTRRLHPDVLPPDEAQYHRRVWLHRVGTDPERDDVLVFGDGRDKTDYLSAHVSEDGRWLVVSAAQGTSPRNDVYLADLDRDGTLTAIQEGYDAQVFAGVEFDGRLYAFTNRDAPSWKLAVADPPTADPAGWQDLLPEGEGVLTGFAVTRTAIVAARQVDAVARLTVHDRITGRYVRDIELPGPGTVAGLSTRMGGGDDVWFHFSDFTTPGRVYQYAVADDRLEVWAEPPGAPDIKGMVARHVFYESKDGTRVPMFVLTREGVELDGARPTVLTGYGGFGATMQPGFKAQAIAWTESGGVFAVACLRGGLEYGEEWHRAGMRANKQNVFDDFIAAGEWLVREGYTSPAHLGIIGGSNGGLLVGAALTQRPDLFAAVVCSAPLLDMVRYEHFGLGATWNDEYGRADVAEELAWLFSYSPYHRVEAGTAYPAVLMVLFDSDTRVDPMHGRKMCAALQWATTSDRPVLLRREQNVGHGARSVSREIALTTDTTSFLAQQLGLQVSR